MLKYPPYYFLILVRIKTKDYEFGFKESSKIADYLKSKVEANTIILGPTTSSMFKINNIFHYQIIIKYKKDNNLLNILKFIDDNYKTNNKIDVELDFNPLKI